MRRFAPWRAWFGIMVLAALVAQCRLTQKTLCLTDVRPECRLDARDSPAFQALEFLVSSQAEDRFVITWPYAWGGVSSQKEMSYRLFVLPDRSLIGSALTLAEIPGEARLVLDWTTGVSSWPVEGLSSDTSYTVAVVARNSAGKHSILFQEVTTFVTGAPQLTASLSFSDIGKSSVTVSWGAASSLDTPLQYRVVRGKSAAALVGSDTGLGDEAFLVSDWTENLLSVEASGLTPGSEWFFVVWVKDASGKGVALPVESMQTLFPSHPLPKGELKKGGSGDSFITVLLPGITEGNGGGGSGGGEQVAVIPGMEACSGSQTGKAEYRLVMARDPRQIDTLLEVLTLAPEGIVQEWTENLTEYKFENLAPGTLISVTLVARGSNGYCTLVGPESFVTTDGTAPTTTGAISVTDEEFFSALISWPLAVDNGSLSEKLSYKAVLASSAAAIDSVSEIEAISGEGLILDWSQATTRVQPTTLTAGTTYFIAVMVKDEAGNKGLYSPVSFTTTPDPIAPGKGTTPVVGTRSFDGASFSWGAGTDNDTSTNRLSYKLVVSTEASLVDTVEEADALTGNSIVMDWTTATLSRTITGLSAGANYTLAVLVRDTTGNKALYDLVNFSTWARIFLTASTKRGNFGGILAADAACSADTNKPSTGTYRALLVDGVVRQACGNSGCTGAEQINWVLKPNVEYRRSSGEVIDTTNSVGTFDFNLTNSIGGLTTDFVWTGLQTNFQTSPNTCSGWTTLGGANSAIVGVSSATDSTSMSSGTAACDTTNSYRFYCVEQ